MQGIGGGPTSWDDTSQENTKIGSTCPQFGGKRESEWNTDADFSETKFSLFIFRNVKGSSNLSPERTFCVSQAIKFQLIAGGLNPIMNPVL